MSKLETITIDTPSGSNTMQIGSTNTATINLGVSGDTINVPAGVTIANAGTATGFGDDQLPAFFAYAGSNQTITNNTWTKIQVNTEDLDSGSKYDNSSNYRFTPTVAGRYVFQFGVNIFTSSQTDINYIQVAIYKNGSNYGYMYNDFQASRVYGFQTNGSFTITSDTDDYFELYARCQTNSGNNPVVQGHGGRVTFFGATRIAGLTS
jgi:hypothetical protein